MSAHTYSIVCLPCTLNSQVYHHSHLHQCFHVLILFFQVYKMVMNSIPHEVQYEQMSKMTQTFEPAAIN
jgi:hypothetical protein